MRKLIKKIWSSIRKMFNKLKGTTKEVIPIAIKIVEGVKKVMDTQIDDIVLTIVKNAIPGTADDILIDKVTKFVEKELPKILLQLNIIQSIVGIKNSNEQLKAILAQFNLSSDQQKNKAYHEIAYLTIEALSDGKITRSEAIVLSEYYYTNILKKAA